MHWVTPPEVSDAGLVECECDKSAPVGSERQDMGDHPAVREDLRRVAERVDEGVVQLFGGYNSPDLGEILRPIYRQPCPQSIEAAMRWLKANPPDDHWIVDPVLALGDGNLDNVMWDGSTARLVDWEEFGVSDLAYEVAGVVEHASSRLDRRLDISSLLTALRLSTDQQERLSRHRRMFACFWLAMLLPGNGSWGRNPPGATEDQARHVLRLLTGKPVLIGDPTRPVAVEPVLERLGLAQPLVAPASDVLDEQVDPPQHPSILLLPPEVVLPGRLVEHQPHSSSSRA